MKRKRQKAPPREAARDESATAADGGARVGDCAVPAAATTTTDAAAGRADSRDSAAAGGGAEAGESSPAAATGVDSEAGLREPGGMLTAQLAGEATEKATSSGAVREMDTSSVAPDLSGAGQCSSEPSSSSRELGEGTGCAPEGGSLPTEGAGQGSSGRAEGAIEPPGSRSDERAPGDAVRAWETRRQGAAAARLLRDVSIS